MLNQIVIAEDLKKVGSVTLGIVQAEVVVEAGSLMLWDEINQCVAGVLSRHSLDLLTGVAEINALRRVYQNLGKDPSRYRGSAESLTRRVLQGKGLYKVNNIVDINNLVSLSSLHSVGSYDIDKLKFPAQFRIGVDGESYKGIGKEIINIAGLPVFSDEGGAYGSPTSDSEKAMIRPETKNIMMVVISFTGADGLDEHVSMAKRLLEKHASARNLSTYNVA